MIAYKLFRVKKNGDITSLFINKKKALPLNEWMEAEDFPTNGFAFRPGWHCTNSAHAPHLSMKNRAWFKVKIKNFTIIKRPDSQGGIWYLAKWIKIYE